MSEYLTPEEDLKYQLSTLASYEPDDIDNPGFEVCYETASGSEGFMDVCCIDVGDRALKRIVKLEGDNDRLTAQVAELTWELKVAAGYIDEYGRKLLGCEPVGVARIEKLLTRIGDKDA